MKTVRFTEVVKRCGAPEPHLVLVAPPQDKTLQAAVKANRVMTLFQATTGNKVDYGSVGFEKGASRQFLIFPKSLRPFADRRIIGIKYELFSAAEVPKDRQAPRGKARKVPRARKPKAPKRSAPLKPVKTKREKPKAEARRAKIIPFQSHDRDEGVDSQDLRQARKLARQAMDALEDGKQVAAFNLLKRILAL